MQVKNRAEMELEGIMLSEKSQRMTSTACFDMWDVKKAELM